MSAVQAASRRARPVVLCACGRPMELTLNGKLHGRKHCNACSEARARERRSAAYAARCETAGRRAHPARAWWLEPGAVKASPPGAVSVREAEGRVMRALLAHLLDGTGGARLGARTSSAALEVLVLPRPAAPARGVAAVDDVERDRALAWLGGLDETERTVLAMRCDPKPAPWPAIGAELGIGTAAARAAWDRAIDKVRAAANRSGGEGRA